MQNVHVIIGCRHWLNNQFCPTDKFGRIDSDIAVKTIGLARDLTQDASHEVQAFAKAVLADASPSGSEPNGGPAPTTFRPRVERTAATFSRPPPPTPS